MERSLSTTTIHDARDALLQEGGSDAAMTPVGSVDHGPVADRLLARAFSCPFARVSAPMVRYSKLAFRDVLRAHHVDLCFTPMIVAHDFVRSARARDAEWTTHALDRPLIVQFAASDAVTLATASQYVQQHCDGVDLNSGCPQRWAMQAGYGAALLSSPALVADMVRTTWQLSGCPVSVKLRIVSEHRTDVVTARDAAQTVALARQLEHAHVSLLTVHGRNAYQSPSAAVHADVIRLVRENVAVPVLANGGVMTYSDAVALHDATGVHGVMAARGLLQNPALFSVAPSTPLATVKQYFRLALCYGTPFSILHHQLIFMLENVLSRVERRHFNALSSVAGIRDFFDQRYPSTVV